MNHPLLNDDVFNDGTDCLPGTRRMGFLIINSFLVPGFQIEMQCYRIIPNPRLPFWTTSVENLRPSDGPSGYNLLHGTKGFWLSDTEKSRVQVFCDDFLQRMSDRLGRPIRWNGNPGYHPLRKGRSILLWTNEVGYDDAQHVISEMTGAPLADVMDVNDLIFRLRRLRGEAQARLTPEARLAEFPLNYTGAPTRNIPAGSENAISYADIRDGTQMVDLLFNGGLSKPQYLFTRDTFESMVRQNPNPILTHPFNRHTISRRNVVPYIARVVPAPAAAGPAAAGAGAPAVPLNRNARRRLLANAAERRIRRLEGGKTRRTKKSKSRKH